MPPPEPRPEVIRINLKNGTFECTDKGWQLQQFDPGDFLTYQLPFAYDPTANCPLFEAFLLTVLPDESLRMQVQEFVGYIFTNLNLEKCLVLTGPGGNGKSVFMNVITALVGAENTLQYSMGHFAKDYSVAQLENKLLNYSSEKGFDLNPDIFKALVSCEPLHARVIFKSPFTMRSRAKFIMNCNELPQDTENTDAYFRRMLVIPFVQKILESIRDIDLAQKIVKSELPGVMNWALQGVERLLKNKAFTYSEASDIALRDFRTQSDNVLLFIRDGGLVASSHFKMEMSTLYLKYKSFCLEDGYKPKGKNKFSIAMERAGFERTRTSVGSVAFFVTQGVDQIHDPFKSEFRTSENHDAF